MEGERANISFEISYSLIKSDFKQGFQVRLHERVTFSTGVKEGREWASTSEERQGEEQEQRPCSGSVPIGCWGQLGAPRVQQGARGEKSCSWSTGSETMRHLVRDWFFSEMGNQSMGGICLVGFYSNQVFILQNFHLYISQKAFLSLSQEAPTINLALDSTPRSDTLLLSLSSFHVHLSICAFWAEK